MDRAVAEMLIAELDKFSEPINNLSALSDKLGDKIAGETMRRHLGTIMFEVEDIWRPIVREFPDLDPETSRQKS